MTPIAPSGARAISSAMRASAAGVRMIAAGRGPEDESEQVDPTGEEARNPQEYLYAYLRSRDADAEGLPESFRIKLRKALSHYGVPDLDASDAHPELPPHAAVRSNSITTS